MIFTIPTPKDEQTALRQVRCYDKALRMEAEGYAVDVEDVLTSGLYYRVTSPAGAVYNVDPLTGKCSCPDFAKHAESGICKHTLFVNLWDAKEEAKRDAAQASAYEAMYGACELETTGCDPYARY